MKDIDLLFNFFSSIEHDPRISIAHIALFAALLKYRQERGYCSPFRAFSVDIMYIAKISSCTTYHKYIRELKEYGYIIYIPSFKKTEGSTLDFPILNQKN